MHNTYIFTGIICWEGDIGGMNNASVDVEWFSQVICPPGAKQCFAFHCVNTEQKFEFGEGKNSDFKRYLEKLN